MSNVISNGILEGNDGHESTHTMWDNSCDKADWGKTYTK